MRVAPRGLLKIHAPVTFGNHRLAPALADYLRLFPEVQVNLTLSDRDIDVIEEGYEAAIRIGDLPDSYLIARPLKPFTMCLSAAPAYLAESGIPQTAADLAGHDCLGFAYWRKKDVWRLCQGEQIENVHVAGRLTVNNGQALKAAAIAGLGIILQPEILVADVIADGRLARLLPGYELPSRPMYRVCVADRRPTPKLKTCIDFAVAVFG